MNAMRIACLIERSEVRTGPATYRAMVEQALAVRHTLGFFTGMPTGDWDLVHLLDIKRVPLSLVRRLTRPIVADLHDYYWAEPPRFPAPDLPLRWLLQRYRRRHHLAVLDLATSVIVHSRAVAAALPAGLQPELVPLGIDPQAFVTSPQPREPLLLLVGRDCFRKGLPVLLSALRRLRSRLPELRLEVIGDEYPHGRRAGKILAAGLPVRFLPGMPTAELRERYARAAALILPSYQEAFGLVLLEAMAAGLPVVASRVGGIPELVEDGVNGLLFTCGRAEELAEKIKMLMTEPKLRERLAQAGRETIPGRFDLPRLAAGLEQVYERTVTR